MNYLLTIIAFYIIFKFLFVAAHTSFTERILFNSKKEFLLFIINPLLSKKYLKDKYFSLYYYLSFALTLVWSLVLATKLNEFLDIIKINYAIGILYILAIIIFISFLLYLSIFDVMSFSIPEIISKRMLLFALSINLVFLILKILLNNTDYSYIFGLINLGSIFNLIAGLMGGGIIWVIVKISRERAMGAGDIDILAAIGLMVGLPGIFYSFFYTLMAASLISILYVLIIRKYKGVLIPFVPFLSTGFILCLVISDFALRLFSIY